MNSKQWAQLQSAAPLKVQVSCDICHQPVWLHTDGFVIDVRPSLVVHLGCARARRRRHATWFCVPGWVLVAGLAIGAVWLGGGYEALAVTLLGTGAAVALAVAWARAK